MHVYRGILSSIVADDTKAPWVPLGPVCDVINLPIDNQPLVIPAAVALHLLPGVLTATSPAAWLTWLCELASTTHPRCLWPESTCTLKGQSATNFNTWMLKNGLSDTNSQRTQL